MDGMTVLWIVVGVIVVLIVLALVAAAAKKSKRRHNEQIAREHEQQAQVAAAHADKQQAAADEVDARARQAQAIADEKAAEARRLNAGATERQAAADQARSESAHHQQQAEALRPSGTGHPEPSADPNRQGADAHGAGRSDGDGRDTSPHTAGWGADPRHAQDADRSRAEAEATPDTADQPMRGSTDDQVAPGAVARSPEGVQPVVDEQADGCPADMNTEHFGGEPDEKPGEAPGSEQSPKHAAPRR